jgi:hypothetical protein
MINVSKLKDSKPLHKYTIVVSDSFFTLHRLDFETVGSFENLMHTYCLKYFTNNECVKNMQVRLVPTKTNIYAKRFAEMNNAVIDIIASEDAEQCIYELANELLNTLTDGWLETSKDGIITIIS